MKPVNSKGLYCTDCKVLCYTYEQGLACDCDSPWITEVINEDEFPEKWIPCIVSITFPMHPQTYFEAYNLPEDYELREQK